MSLIVPSRRGFLAGLVGLVAAPAVIRVADLMQIKPLKPPIINPYMLKNTIGPWPHALGARDLGGLWVNEGHLVADALGRLPGQSIEARLRQTAEWRKYA